MRFYTDINFDWVVPMIVGVVPMIEAIWHVIAMGLLGLFIFFGLWIIYWFSWFMLSCIGVVLTKGKSITVGFWVCCVFGFMCSTIHSLIWLFLK